MEERNQNTSEAEDEQPGCVMSNPNKTVTTFVDFTEPKITF